MCLAHVARSTHMVKLILAWPPRLPETGRSNELMKLAFPHLGNHNVGLAATAARDWP